MLKRCFVFQSLQERKQRKALAEAAALFQLIQYAQSAVFTPCDFAFPNDGKRSEATPNTEMILISDVDLNLLNELHTYGAVRNMRDRRKDLYELKKK